MDGSSLLNGQTWVATLSNRFFSLGAQMSPLVAPDLIGSKIRDGATRLFIIIQEAIGVIQVALA